MSHNGVLGWRAVGINTAWGRVLVRNLDEIKTGTLFNRSVLHPVSQCPFGSVSPLYPPYLGFSFFVRSADARLCDRGNKIFDRLA